VVGAKRLRDTAKRRRSSVTHSRCTAAGLNSPAADHSRGKHDDATQQFKDAVDDNAHDTEWKREDHTSG
jgi:hypothetical protein